MDQIKIKNIIQNLLNTVNITDTDFVLNYDEDSLIWFASVKTPHYRLFSGKNSDTLASLNFILRRILEKDLGEESLTKEIVLIDINNEQKKHIESIRATANMMAERARYFKSSIDMDNMSSFDRRIAHAHLSKFNDIKTESVGVGKERHIVVKYISTEI